MLIDIVKFLHLLIVLSLLGLTLHCLVSRETISLKRVNVSLLGLSFFAALTGTFLVHPKNFTFHTPWIDAAYFFVVIFAVGIGGVLISKKNLNTNIWLRRFFYFVFAVILLLIIHDAVTKSTFLT